MSTWDDLSGFDNLDGAVGDYARQTLARPALPSEAPVDTQRRQMQEDLAADRAQRQQQQDLAEADRQQRIRGADFAEMGVPTVKDSSGNVQPITDDAGAPLTNYDKKNSIAWDSTGAPKAIKRDLIAGTASLADPFEGVPTETQKDGNKYKIRPGLPWQHQGQDDAVVAANAQAEKDKAIAKAATAMSGKLTVDQHDRVTAEHDLKGANKSFQVLSKKVGIDPMSGSGEDFVTAIKSGDLEGAHSAIDDHFNTLYGSDKANSHEGWFGSTLSPEALAYRDSLDRDKGEAHALADKILTTSARMEGARAREEATRAQHADLQRQHTDAVMRASGLSDPSTGADLAEGNRAQGEPATGDVLSRFEHSSALPPAESVVPGLAQAAAPAEQQPAAPAVDPAAQAARAARNAHFGAMAPEERQAALTAEREQKQQAQTLALYDSLHTGQANSLVDKAVSGVHDFGQRVLESTAIDIHEAIGGAARLLGMNDIANYASDVVADKKATVEGKFGDVDPRTAHGVPAALAGAVGMVLSTLPAAAAAALLPEIGVGAGVAGAAATAGNMIIGMVPIATQFFAAAHAEAYDATIKEGGTVAQAKDAGMTASVGSLKSLPFYMLGGGVASTLEKQLLPEVMPLLTKGLSRFFIHGAVNTTISTGVRSYEQGSFSPLTFDNTVGDFAFAAQGAVHGTVHEIKEQKKATAQTMAMSHAIIDGTSPIFQTTLRASLDPDVDANLRNTTGAAAWVMRQNAEKFIEQYGKPADKARAAEAAAKNAPPAEPEMPAAEPGQPGEPASNETPTVAGEQPTQEGQPPEPPPAEPVAPAPSGPEPVPPTATHAPMPAFDGVDGPVTADAYGRQLDTHDAFAGVQKGRELKALKAERAQLAESLVTEPATATHAALHTAQRARIAEIDSNLAQASEQAAAQKKAAKAQTDIAITGVSDTQISGPQENHQPNNITPTEHASEHVAETVNPQADPSAPSLTSQADSLPTTTAAPAKTGATVGESQHGTEAVAHTAPHTEANPAEIAPKAQSEPVLPQKTDAKPVEIAENPQSTTQIHEPTPKETQVPESSSQIHVGEGEQKPAEPGSEGVVREGAASPGAERPIPGVEQPSAGTEQPKHTAADAVAAIKSHTEGAHAEEIEHLGVKIQDGKLKGSGLSTPMDRVGTVIQDPAKLAKSMDTVRKNGKDPQEWVKSAVGEELIHTRQLAHSGNEVAFKEKYAALFDSLPEDLQKLVKKAYPSKISFELGAEYERMVIQERETGTFSEEASGKDVSKLKELIQGEQIQALEESVSKLGRMTPDKEATAPVKGEEALKTGALTDYVTKWMRGEVRGDYVGSVSKLATNRAEIKALLDSPDLSNIKPGKVGDAARKMRGELMSAEHNLMRTGLDGPPVKSPKVAQSPAVETPKAAAVEIKTEIAKTFTGANKRSAKEIKTELIQRLTEAIKSAPEESEKGNRFIEIHIPGDGTFKLSNTKEILTDTLKRVSKMSVDLKPVGPRRIRGVGKTDAQHLASQAYEQLGGKDAALEWLRENSQNSTPGEKKVNEAAIEILKSSNALHAAEPELSRPATSNKKAVRDEEREAAGKVEIKPLVKPTPDEAMKHAQETLSRDPEAGHKLVSRLNADHGLNRTISEADVMLLGAHKVQLQNERAKQADIALDGATKEDRDSANKKWDELESQLNDVDIAANAAGSTWSSMGHLQKQMIKADYGFEALERKARKAKDGKPLTKEESDALGVESKELVAHYEEKLKLQAQRLTEKHEKAQTEAVNKAVEQARKEDEIHPMVKFHVERFLSSLDDVDTSSPYEAKKAAIRAARKVSSDSLNAAEPEANKFDANAFKEEIAEGGKLLAKKNPSKEKWIKAMDFEPEQAIHADAIYEASRKWVASRAEKFFGNSEAVQKTKDAIKRRVTSADTTAQAKEKIMDGMRAASEKKGGAKNLGAYLERLAVQFAKEGVKAREPMIDALHKAAGEIVPGITKEEVMQQWTRYGEVHEATKVPEKIIAAQLRGETIQAQKLMDMAKGDGPKRTGPQRVEQSDEYRALTKQVEDAKRRGGYTVTDAAKQLKTSEGAIRTRLENEIADMDLAISKGKRILDKKSDTKYSKEIEQLKARRDAKRAEYDVKLPPKEPTHAERVAAAGKALDRSIADVQEQIKTGKLYPESSAKLTAPELTAKRAHLDALRDERQVMRKLDTAHVEAERVKDLEKQIAKLEKPTAKDGATAAPTVDTAEVAALKNRRQELIDQKADANRVAALDRAIASQEARVAARDTSSPEKSQAVKTAAVTEREAKLKALNEQLQKLRAGDTGRQIEAAGKALDRSIAEVQEQIATGRIHPESKAKLSTPELDAKRATLEKLKSDRQAMRDSDATHAEAAKERALTAQIAELERQKAEGFQAEVKAEPKPTADTAALDALQRQRAQLLEEKADAHRIAALDKAIAAKKAKIAEGDVSTPAKNQDVKSAEETTKAAELKKLNAELQALRAKDETRQLEQWKASRTRALADLLNREATGDLKPAKRAVRTVQPDREMQKLDIEIAKSKIRIDNRLAQIGYENRTPLERFTGALAAVNRAFVLSGVSTIAHLGGAAVMNAATRPVFSAAAQLMRIHPVLNAIRVKAIHEGGWGGEKEGAKATLTSYAEAWKKLRTGESDNDHLHGDGKVFPKQWGDKYLAWIGHVHSFMKEPVRQGIFARSRELGIQSAEARGIDPHSDELEMRKIDLYAYARSYDDIMLGKNVISDWLQKGTTALRNSKTSPAASKLLADVIDILLPVVNVPTNIAIRKMQLLTGLPQAAIGIAKAHSEGKLANGAEHLTTEEAEHITRCLKYGLVGVALMAYAWKNADQFGGVFTAGKQAPHPKGLEPGEIKLADGSIVPHSLSHDPIMGTAHIIADAKRQWLEEKKKNPDSKWSNMTETAAGIAMADASGLALVSTGARLTSPYKSAGAKAGDIVRSMFIPQLVQDIAKWDDKGTKRKGATFVDEVKLGLPGVRKSLPESKGRAEHGDAKAKKSAWESM